MSETPRTDAILTEWMPKITAADGDAECKAVILGFVRVLGYHARDLELELAAMRAERDEPRALLREVYDYLESLKFTPNPNAPGHRHNIPGRWDGDGAACTWCATWARVRACVQQPDIHHRDTEATENG